MLVLVVPLFAGGGHQYVNKFFRKKQKKVKSTLYVRSVFMILDMIHATHIDTHKHTYDRLHIYWIVIYILFLTLGPIQKSLTITGLEKLFVSYVVSFINNLFSLWKYEK